MIYLDNNATTRLAPEALEAMLPFFREHFGNPSSAHLAGRLPEGALVRAREQVAALLGGQPAEIVFNSGGTEGINHVLKGVFEAFPAKRHLVITAVEHHAVQAVGDWLKTKGVEVTTIGVDQNGELDLDALASALRPETALVSVMAANNETGVVFPIKQVAAIVQRHGTLLHVDAVQAAGKWPMRAAELGVDLLNVSGHKFHGPKGTGALYVRRGLRLRPLISGGQERGRRGGTENVPSLVGLGVAADLALAHLGQNARIAALRDRLEAAILSAVPDSRAHGSRTDRLPNTCLLSFRSVEGEALLLRLSDLGICVSTGSACTTGQKEPSHVLRAMKVPPEEARGTIRLSLSRETTEAEIARVIEVLPSLVRDLRSLGPMGR